MKNKICSKVGILLAAMVLINTSIQAQSWLNQKVLTVNNSLKTNTYAQKVRPYGDDMLIGLSKKYNVEHYCFEAWQDGQTSVIRGFLNAADIVVSDFKVFDDTVYFCGKRLTNQGNYIGVIGRFDIASFISGGNAYYDLTDINATSNLTSLIAYRKPASHVIYVVAIGLQDNIIGNILGRYVFMYYDSYTGVTNYRVRRPSTPTVTSIEYLQDIALTDNHVVTVSRLYPDNAFIVRTFDMADPSNEQASNNFTCPNLSFYTTSDPYEYPVHITALNVDTIALSVGATDGPNDFTMVSKLHPQSQNISSTQQIYHFDKESKVLEMDYSSETNKLLLLTSSNFQGQGIKQTINILNPDATQSYLAPVELLTAPNELNHLSVSPHSRYALAGVYPDPSSGTPYRSLSIRCILYNVSQCIQNYSTKIAMTNLPAATNASTLSPLTQAVATWASDSFGLYLDSWNTDCVE
ncbi:MAG: hypothetical protein MSH09_03220 [Bacteroidales bacterium]|nr:hypothetical protein [Bacteroidales bacterium]